MSDWADNITGQSVTSLRDWSEFAQPERRLGTLVRRTAEGDESALAVLFDVTSHRIYGLALRILGESGAAEDVTVEVFMQIWQQASGYDPSRSPVLGWMLMLARSRSIDRLRSGVQRRAREAPLEKAAREPSGMLDPEQTVSQTERGHFVRSALLQLAPEQRKLIEMAYFGGFSQSEMAARLGQPLGTVKTRIRAGLMRLRELLKPLDQQLAS